MAGDSWPTASEVHEIKKCIMEWFTNCLSRETHVATTVIALMTIRDVLHHVQLPAEVLEWATYVPSTSWLRQCGEISRVALSTLPSLCVTSSALCAMLCSYRVSTDEGVSESSDYPPEDIEQCICNFVCDNWSLC